MRNYILLLFLISLFSFSCREKNEVSVPAEEKIMLNNESISALNRSEVGYKLTEAEQRMMSIISSIEMMEVDTADPEISGLMKNAGRELSRARRDLGKVVRKLEQNRIEGAESRLDEINAELHHLQDELTAHGY